MQSETNVLKRRDLASLSAVENAFHTGLLEVFLHWFPDIERRQQLSQQQFENNYRKKSALFSWKVWQMTGQR